MQKSIWTLTILLVLSMALAGCNLDAGTIEEPTEIVLQATATQQVFTTSTTAPTSTPRPTNTAPSLATLPPVACAPRSDWQTYTVASGDTLAAIARRANTTVNNLISGNCLANPNLITVGQVLRVPNALAPATVPPTLTTQPPAQNCQYYDTTGSRQVFESQGYVYPLGLIERNRRYPVIERSDFSYHITLPDGRNGWVQLLNANLEGNCTTIPYTDVYVYHPVNGTEVEICYFVADTAFTVWYDSVRTQVDPTPKSANTLYRVDARTSDMVRIVGGPDINLLPAWANSAAGRTVNRCGALPDFSLNLTINGPRATHVDTMGGFAFEYPANWPLRMNNDGLPGGQVGTHSWIGSYPGAMGWPTDVVRVSWVLTPPPLNTDPEQAARSYVQTIRDLNGRIGVVQDVASMTTASGIVVWHFILDGVEAPNHVYLFKIRANVIELSIQGRNDYGNVVINTLRPA
jgi:LysM repeat protein